MKRLLIIPAAGRGTRLGWTGPKALAPVGGRPMLDVLVDRYAGLVQRLVVVAAPSGAGALRERLSAAPVPGVVVVQAEPTGMLPAIRCADDEVRAARPEQVWITWCDQVGILSETASRLARELDEDEVAFAFPTVRQTPPYIHFVRDNGGRLTRVLHRRDGDTLPETGESDAGLFGMRLDVFLEDLPAYDRGVPPASGGRERNFLPFIPWLASRRPVRTFNLTDPREAIGVNTPADLAALEAFLRERA